LERSLFVPFEVHRNKIAQSIISVQDLLGGVLDFDELAWIYCFA